MRKVNKFLLVSVIAAMLPLSASAKEGGTIEPSWQVKEGEKPSTKGGNQTFSAGDGNEAATGGSGGTRLHCWVNEQGIERCDARLHYCFSNEQCVEH